MQAPLAGIKVLELARILAGPWAGQTLADLGADVVKVESPNGDDTRRWGPPFITRNSESNAAYFHCCNRGKRSIVLDFKNAADRQTAFSLACRADVILENFKVGGLKKFGLDYAAVAAVNPQVVYCSISGFGQTGTAAQKAGYDFLVQGMGGIMSVTGAADGEPQKVGVAIADIFTGLYAVIAIQAVLADRVTSGRGRHLDLSLLDCMVGVMANQALNYLATGNPPARLGNVHPNIAPYQTLPTVDGYIILAVGNDSQFSALCRLLGIAGMATDARFTDNAARLQNRAALTAILTKSLADWTQSAFLSAAAAANVPAAPINDMAAVFADPQVRDRKMQIQIDNIPGVRLPPLFDGDSAVALRPSPNLNEHKKEILSSWLTRQ